MNLAICSMGELFGGVERQILDLCTFLERSSDEPPIVVLFHDLELASQLRERNIHPEIISGRNKYDFRMVAQIAEFLSSRQIEVVHSHGYKATIACALAKNRYPFRLVKTEHGKLEPTFSHPISWLKSKTNFALEQYLTRRSVDHVCYVTNDIKRFFDSHHQGLARTTVYNGIDPLERGNFPRPEDLPVDRFNVGIVGRVTGVKGIPFAIRALAEPGVPDEIELTIVGTGSLVGELTALSRQLKIEKRVRIIGFRTNIFDYLAHIDALMMPSFHEGLPYTLLEAMSFERPIIASRVGGLAEVLLDGETGRLVEVGDVEGLALAMTEIRSNKEFRKTIGFNGKLRQAQSFTLDEMGQEYLKVWSQAI